MSSRDEKPTAVLSAPGRIPRPHGGNDCSGTERVQELRDAHLFLALLASRGSTAIGEWISLGPDIPLSDVGPGLYGMGERGEIRHVPHSVTPEQIRVVGESYRTFKALTPDAQDHLRIPLRRLNRAKDRASTTDSAIELGIALESLFLAEDEQDELGYRLRTRAARLLETEPGARHTAADLVRDLYRIRSMAVHRGRLGAKVSKRPIGDLLHDGYGFTARAIEKTIHQGGQIDWAAFDLS